MLNTKSAVTGILPGEVGDSTAREIYRNLRVLYGTVTGGQALDQEFGTDGSVIDYPQENAQVLLVAEYMRKTERYEPRTKVAYVGWTDGKAQDGIVTPKVVIEVV